MNKVGSQFHQALTSLKIQAPPKSLPPVNPTFQISVLKFGLTRNQPAAGMLTFTDWKCHVTVLTIATWC